MEKAISLPYDPAGASGGESYFKASIKAGQIQVDKGQPHSGGDHSIFMYNIHGNERSFEMNFNQAVTERIHEMLTDEPYREEFAALGISHEDWEVFQRVVATLEIADELDAPDPKVRERYARINATEYTMEDIEKGKKWAKDAGL